MKLFNKIEKAVEETYFTQKYLEILVDKYKSTQYLKWSEQFNDIEFVDSKLVNITTGSSNLGFGCRAYNITEIKTDQVLVNHHFVIKKSMISDFVTFYGVIEYYTHYKDEKISGPKLYVLSPLGPFVEYFKEAWKLMKFHYPNCTYLHYTALNLEFEIPNLQKKTVLELFFRKGFEPFLNVVGESYYRPE